MKVRFISFILAVFSFVFYLASASAQTSGGLPDFSVTNPRMMVFAREPMLAVTMTNIGSAAAYNIPVRFYWTDVQGNLLPVGARFPLQARSSVQSLQVGGSIDYVGTSISGNLGDFLRNPPAGAVGFRVVIDPDGVVPELDETNNVFNFPAFPFLPELRFDNIMNHVVRPDSLHLPVVNVGQVPLTAPLILSLQWVSGTSTNAAAIGQETRITYTGGISKSVSSGNYPNVFYTGLRFNFKTVDFPDADYFMKHPPAGARYIRVTIDPDNTIPELMETNNVLIPILPEVADFDVHSPRMRVFAREPMLAVTVTNISNVEASEIPLRFYWIDNGGNLLPRDAYFPLQALSGISRLRAGESIDYVGPSAHGNLGGFLRNPPAGATSFRVVVDPEDELLESDETNNTFDFPAFPFLPELRFGGEHNFVVRPDKIKVYVYNSGQVELSSPLPIAFQWIAGTSTNAAAIGPEARITYRGVIGKSASEGNYPNITFNGTPLALHSEEYPEADQYIKNPPEGARYLRLTLDPDNSIPELNEGNNSIVLSPPTITDFEVTSMEMQEDRFRVTMRNLGGSVDSLLVHFFWMNSRQQLLPVGAYFPMSYRVSVATFREGVEREIGPQKRYDEFLSEPPEGAAAIRIVIDPNDEILESNEGNNTYEFVLSGQAMAEMDEEGAALDLAEEVDEGIDEGSDVAADAAPASEEAVPQEQGASAEQAPSSQVSESGGATSGESGASKKKGADPKVLPGNPFYFLKDGARGVSLLFTFGKENKAKAHLKFANEKLLEANKLAKLGKEEKAVSHLDKYVQDLNAAKKLAGQIQDTKPDVSENLASTILRNEVKQLQVLGGIEKRVSSLRLEVFQEAKNGVLEGITESVALVQDPQAVEKAITSAVATTGSPLKQFRNLEVLQKVYEQVPEQAKGSISFVIEKSASRLDKEVSSLSSPDGGALFTDYVKQTGGSEVSYLKVLDGLKQNEKVSLDKKVLDGAKKGTVALLGDRLSKAGGADAFASQKVIHELEGISSENFQVVQDIKKSIDPKLVSLVQKAENVSLKNLDNSGFSNAPTEDYAAFKEELRAEKPAKEKKAAFSAPKVMEPKEPLPSPTLEHFAEELTKKQFSLPEGPSPFQVVPGGDEPVVTVDLNELYKQTFDALSKYNQQYLEDAGVSSEDLKKAYESLPSLVPTLPSEIPTPTDMSLQFPTQPLDYSFIPSEPALPVPVPTPAPTETKLAIPEITTSIPDVTKLQIPSVSSGVSSEVKPDFIIVSGSVSVSPSPLAVGKSATFRATIQNIGGDAGTFQSDAKNVAIGTEGSSEAYLEIDTNGDGSWDVLKKSSMSPLGSQKTSLKSWFGWAPAKAGTYAYRVCADGSNKVFESNEKNNCYTAKLSVK